MFVNLTKFFSVPVTAQPAVWRGTAAAEKTAESTVWFVRFLGFLQP